MTKKIIIDNTISNLVFDDNWHIISIRSNKFDQIEKLLYRWAASLAINIIIYNPKKYNKILPTNHIYINLDTELLQALHNLNIKNGNILGKIEKISKDEFTTFYDNINKYKNNSQKILRENQSYLITSGAFAGLNITILEIKNNIIIGNVIVFGRETKIELSLDNITIS